MHGFARRRVSCGAADRPVDRLTLVRFLNRSLDPSLQRRWHMVSPDRDVATLVRQELRSLLEAEGRHAGDIAPSDVLTEELGLSSAQVAQLLARVGTRLGIAPPMESFTDVRTVGDLCALYQPASRSEPRRGEANPLESSSRRAEARRRARRA